LIGINVRVADRGRPVRIAPTKSLWPFDRCQSCPPALPYDV